MTSAVRGGNNGNFYVCYVGCSRFLCGNLMYSCDFGLDAGGIPCLS